MKHYACLLWGLGAVSGSCLGAAQETPVLTQEYRAAEGRPGFWWTRRLDEYTLQFMPGGTVRMAMPSAATADVPRPVPTIPPADSADSGRATFFVGNTIANLRGLDPSFGCRTLTLIDRRRVAGGSTEPRASVSPPSQPAVTRNDAPGAPVTMTVSQVWLLKRDGSTIDPHRKSPPDVKFCDSGSVYGFGLSDGRGAVAVAIKVGDKTYIQQLEPFADQVD